MREETRRLWAALSGAASLPPVLSEAIRRLEESRWPEMAPAWSVLTPSGFPIEFTVSGTDDRCRWTAEVAGPELAERDRLRCAARLLGHAVQAVPQNLLRTMIELHAKAAPTFGAWIGGREREGADASLKLYAEIPGGTDVAGLGLPRRLGVVSRLPPGWSPRMVGAEPLRGRTELYLGLPPSDPVDLLPFFQATGCPHALETLAQSLPDGLRRLAGRRLGVSIACDAGGALEVSLFISARTLFPADLSMLVALVPVLAKPLPAFRLGLVTLALGPKGDGLAAAVGIAPKPAESVSTSRLTTVDSVQGATLDQGSTASLLASAPP